MQHIQRTPLRARSQGSTCLHPVYGTTCTCCGFDFEKVYGEHGRGFIHVHHIKPLHTIGENYVVDPVTDMLPLCPNCHAMVHRGSKVLLVEELKKKMRFWSE